MSIICAMSDVTVDFPLVPVTPIILGKQLVFESSWYVNSISEMIGSEVLG